MPVSQIDLLLGNGIVQDEAGQKMEIWQQQGGAVAAAVAQIFFTVVMISIKHIKPFPAAKFFEQAEYVIVDIYDPGERTVFPQLVAVSKLQIGISFLKIVLKRRKVQVLIL